MTVDQERKMGKTNDEKRTSANEIKQLLLPDEKRNYMISSSNSSISNSMSVSSASTTSHLSEYSSENCKPMESTVNKEQILNKKINIKENKLSKENYILLLNDLKHLKNHPHSSPSTKSSSINSLNQLIKSSPSINSTNLPRSINRSLTFIDQNNIEKCKFVKNKNPKSQKDVSSNQQRLDTRSDDLHRLAKSASSQSQNQATYESKLPQSYSAVFNDKFTAERRYAGFDNLTHLTGQNDTQPHTDNQLKISFKEWFLKKFRTDNEFNFDHSNSKTKKPKLINLKRYSSIDLNRDELECRPATQSNYRQSSTFTEKLNDKENDEPGPSGVQVNTESNEKLNYSKPNLKSQQIANPLRPFYSNCTDIDTWTVDASNPIESTINMEIASNYPPLVCSDSLDYDAKVDKSNRRNNNQLFENIGNNHSNNKNNHKKSILLPKLHNAYCTNTNSSHHHHKSHQENGSNCSHNCSNDSTTRSNSTNSSNVSTSSSTEDNKTNNTLKPISNELSGSLSSVSSDVNTDPMLPICKICHLNGKTEDPLITPCKCSGTMQYIHCKCLMRWLEISKKKSRKPLRCELCQYEYEWKKKFKVGNWQFPKCSRGDKLLHLVFIISIIIMICCALSIIIFFKMHEPAYANNRGRYDLTINEPFTVGFAMMFVFSFCMSLYAQVKARTTLYRLIANFIYLNQQFYINEYEKNGSSIKESAGPDVV